MHNSKLKNTDTETRSTV